VEWLDGLDYDVDPARAEVFYDAVRKYYPGLKDGAIEPGTLGSANLPPKRRPTVIRPGAAWRAGWSPVRDQSPGWAPALADTVESALICHQPRR
jgi:hypothetical protein